MQHSPQEIKTRLDKAVDPEGNVLDMVAVLDLVTTLERLPLTREALETTRIGKTINLLRKKTSNDDLAKRAKKLVKKWQKLVINQIEASRSIDSPLNGSRISSPQINGAIRENKCSSSSLIDRTVRGKKGVKRKRSTSSLNNSPLTLSQDTTSPYTPSDNSSNPSSPFTSITEPILLKQCTPSNETKKPKLMGNYQGKNGGTLSVHNEELLQVKSPISECDGKNNVDKTETCSNKDVHTIINMIQDICSSGETSKSQDNNLSQSLDSVCFDSGIDSIGSNVNTCSSQLTPDQEVESNNSITPSNVQQEFDNQTECKDNHLTHMLVNESVTNNEILGEPCNTTELDTTITSIGTSPKLEASTQPVISIKESEVSEASTPSVISIKESEVLEASTPSFISIKESEVLEASTPSVISIKESEVLETSTQPVISIKESEVLEASTQPVISIKESEVLEASTQPVISIKESEVLEASTPSIISIKKSEVLETHEDTSKEELECEKMEDESSEPKELILDLNQEANGINGRFNDEGTWYSWADVMPYNDGSLHILPYVILD